jgi:MoaA/NifB/PqqE/SkfB family radical SAM enzyme
MAVIRSRLAALCRRSPAQLANAVRMRLRRGWDERVTWRPRELMVFVTRRCNLRCTMCPFVQPTRHAPGAYGDIDPRDFGTFVDRYRAARTIGLVGGEPFLHPELFELISLAAARRLEVSVSTNGLFLDPSTVERLLDSPLAALNVSLDAPTAELYAQRRAGSGAQFSRIVAGIERLAEARERRGSGRPAIIMSYVTGLGTVAGMKEYIALAERLGADQVSFQNVIPYECSPGTAPDSTLRDTPEHRALLSRALAGSSRVRVVPPKLRPEPLRGFFCEQPYRLLAIDGAGNVAPCCIIMPDEQFGNAFRDPDAWNAEPLRRIRRAMGPDPGPAVPSLCRVCWENAGWPPPVRKRFRV